MKIIKEEDYRTIQPNINLNFFDNLNSLEKEQYLYLLSSYEYFLEQYLINIANLKKFDENISVSNLQFELVEEENKDFYQTYGGQNLKYYYIRNNVNISILSNDEKQEFFNILQNSNGNFTDEIKKFIDKTMKKVIRENWLDAKINYGPNANNFFESNGTLIIGIRYNEFKTITDDDSWEKNHDMEDLFLLQNNAFLEKEIEEKLNIKCSVIRYNEFSVKNISKRNNF